MAIFFRHLHHGLATIVYQSQIGATPGEHLNGRQLPISSSSHYRGQSVRVCCAGKNALTRQILKNGGLDIELTNFKERSRTNGAGKMTAVPQTLSDEDTINLSHYIADST